MPVVISDEVLRQANLTEREALIEIACRLFDAGKLSFAHAAELARLPALEMEDALRARGVPRYLYSEGDFEQHMRVIRGQRG